MSIERKGDKLIISIPENTDPEGLQRLIDYIEYNQITIKSKANQEDVDDLSKEVNVEWWKKNKDRLLGK